METRLRVGSSALLDGPSRLLTAPARAEEQASATAFAPYAHSLPSSFQRAKPRVYRSTLMADATRPRQTKCAVITTSGGVGAAVVDDSSRQDGEEEARAESAGRPRLGPTKAAIVGLEELDDGATFLLDFRAGQRPRKAASGAASSSEGARAAKLQDWDAHFLSWEGLSERQRRLELTAAAKSRAIRQLAEAEGVQVPQVHELEQGEHGKSDLVVDAFSRWFLASRQHRQRVREVYLLEELAFAARDPIVHQQLATHGRSAPPSDQVGVPSSLAWREFVTWYALGRSTVMQTHAGDQLLLRERLEERADYLEYRLGVAAATEAELELRAQEEADDPTETLPIPAVFVFEDVKMERPAALDDPTSWEKTSAANRQKELALALLDPQVQVAALKAEIELPDLSSASLEGVDVLALAGKFLPWWKSSSNPHRKAFLAREVDEASRDAAIVKLLRQQQQQSDDGGGEVDAAATLELFAQQYFASDSTRLAFLKKKLFFIRRRSRVGSVAKYGKLPAPLMYLLLPVPVVSSFCFSRPCLAQEEAAHPDEVSVVGGGAAAVADTTEQRQQLEEEAAQQLVSVEDGHELEEAERLRSASETDLMTVEDELSRALGAFVEDESDDEMDSSAMVKPKRSDFSRSYFFGSLPVHFRILSVTSWGGAGSGVDNGDEEIEEEERLEQERERQRLLDQQEAERILEAERQAERLRIEKEKEEKALQARRVRTSELKKVLLHQSELEAQRRLALELERAHDEQRRMEQEELAQHQLSARLEADRRAMEREDAAAQAERRAMRAAAARNVKRMLLEMTEMTAEDERSRRATRELRLRELEEEARRRFHDELYSTFEPFFPSSQLPSEDFLPSIQRRLMNQRQLQALQRPSHSPYTVPFAEAVALEDVEPEPYLARDSRKFALLMGLPVRRSRQQKRSRIPSEEAIIQLQQQKNAAHFPLEDEGRESVSAPPATLLSHKLARRQQERRPRQLPELSRAKADEELTDLSEPRRTTTSQNQRMHHRQELQHPPSLTPFFRGNMIVRGTSQGRARDYSYS